MIKTMLRTAAALAVATVVGAGPVWAGCAEDVEAARKDLPSIDSMNKRLRAEQLLDKALKSLAEGNEKKCHNLVRKARDKIAEN